MDFVIAAYAYENGFLSVKLQDVTQGRGFKSWQNEGIVKKSVLKCSL